MEGLARLYRSERQEPNGDQTTNNPVGDFHAFLFHNMNYVDEKVLQFVTVRGLKKRDRHIFPDSVPHFQQPLNDKETSR